MKLDIKTKNDNFSSDDFDYFAVIQKTLIVET